MQLWLWGYLKVNAWTINFDRSIKMLCSNTTALDNIWWLYHDITTDQKPVDEIAGYLEGSRSVGMTESLLISIGSQSIVVFDFSCLSFIYKLTWLVTEIMVSDRNCGKYIAFSYFTWVGKFDWLYVIWVTSFTFPKIWML